MIRRVLPALLIVIVANLALLIGVAANRSGEPDAAVTMTERELEMRFSSDRDSARQLQVRIDRSGYPYQRWLTRSKLEALGFDVSAATTPDAVTFYARQLPRRSFVVLEYDGPAWQEHLRELRQRQAARAQQMEEVRRGERAEKAVNEFMVVDIEAEERLASRLMPIDASRDAGALRQAYPDRRRHIIVPATIRIQLGDYSAADRLTGAVSLVTSSLVVPRALRGVLDSLAPSSSMYNPRTGGPRYTVTVAYGARHEPWVESIEGIDRSAAPH